MKITPIGTRGVMFTVQDPFPVNVYLINGRDRWFLCDTAFGSGPMEAVKEYMSGHGAGKPLVVLNSHFHWDHVWGNCAFDGATIIAHEKCRAIMQERGEAELERFAEAKRGEVRLVYPTVTFSDKISFPDDGIEIFHTPGHTPDSVSCLDTVDNVLLAGDNIEAPLPCLLGDGLDDLDAYAATLRRYLDLRPGRFVSGHDSEPDEELVRQNLTYVMDFQKGDTRRYEEEPFRRIHEENLAIARGE